MEVTPDHQPYAGSVMSIDPAGMGKDETAYAVVKILNSQLFVTESGGFLGGYTPATLKALARIARENKVNYIIAESNFGDGMFTSLLKPVLSEEVGYPCTIEEVRHSIQKERRIIDTLEPLMNTHKLVVSKSVVEGDFSGVNRYHSVEHKDALRNLTGDSTLYQLFYQMSRLTFDKGSLRHDDRLDALAMAVAYWVERMEQHTDIAVAEY